MTAQCLYDFIEFGYIDFVVHIGFFCQFRCHIRHDGNDDYGSYGDYSGSGYDEDYGDYGGDDCSGGYDGGDYGGGDDYGGDDGGF